WAETVIEAARTTRAARLAAEMRMCRETFCFNAISPLGRLNLSGWFYAMFPLPLGGGGPKGRVVGVGFRSGFDERLPREGNTLPALRIDPHSARGPTPPVGFPPLPARRRIICGVAP